ncbi:hypothetical protein ASPCADRAFT_7595 [Aspergillus carbonarius ITEM 5010]|uniref:Uncharacterized protein n=1 Tax=Aspergillus carbonarius (strain ITEM 5010) TaxID=602072 RepID=A0A1R3RFU9_ASPC5|nr:hypothetical protein ASPCADRAFT_7595 [Aspergillus carbonarius ITEM 5010]
MPSGWNHPSELGVSRRQAGGPTKGRLPPADSHRDPDESQQEDDGPTIHPGMEATSVSEEFPIQEYLERHSVNVSILETGGRIRRCVSSSTISTVSPGIYSPASPPPGVDSTNATTPHRETEEPRQLSEDEPSRNSSPKNRSQAALSLVSTNSEYYYIDPVFVVTNDNQDKEGALMALDTQSSANVMDVALWRDLGIRLEPCSQELIPLQSGSDPVVRIETYGRVREVAWHFAGRERTYVSDFLVADLRDYNMILGRRDIRRFKILAPGPDLERNATTGPRTVDFYCLGPDEITVSLKAVVAEELDVNILTQRGSQALSGIQVQRQEIDRTFYDANGVSYAVRDVVRLQIWKKGEAKLTKHDFYVLADDGSDVHHPCDAILGAQCVIGRVSDAKGVPIAVTQLASQSANDKAIQEQKKREKEAALAQREQERRERERQQAAQRK